MKWKMENGKLKIDRINKKNRKNKDNKKAPEIRALLNFPLSIFNFQLF